MMDTEKLISLGSRILFSLSVLLLFIAIVERLTNIAGYTFLRQTQYTSGRLLEFAAVFLIFVIAMLLRQIREELKHPKKN